MKDETSIYFNGIRYTIHVVDDKKAHYSNRRLFVSPKDFERIQIMEADVITKLEEQLPHINEVLEL